VKSYCRSCVAKCLDGNLGYPKCDITSDIDAKRAKGLIRKQIARAMLKNEPRASWSCCWRKSHLESHIRARTRQLPSFLRHTYTQGRSFSRLLLKRPSRDGFRSFRGSNAPNRSITGLRPSSFLLHSAQHMPSRGGRPEPALFSSYCSRRRMFIVTHLILCGRYYIQKYIMIEVCHIEKANCGEYRYKSSYKLNVGNLQ